VVIQNPFETAKEHGYYSASDVYHQILPPNETGEIGILPVVPVVKAGNCISKRKVPENYPQNTSYSARDSKNCHVKGPPLFLEGYLGVGQLCIGRQSLQRAVGLTGICRNTRLNQQSCREKQSHVAPNSQTVDRWETVREYESLQT
jgi:hypothetical protein